MIQTILNTRDIPVVFLIRYLSFFFNKRRKAKRKRRRAEWTEEEKKEGKNPQKDTHTLVAYNRRYLNYESTIPNDCLLTTPLLWEY